ncbi:N-lysine methyltransferase KMT5A-A-like [Mercenaria mercenaria]|uniref:N-lysine methyltransferase KMT5A-A-like n=1 Tax=Mercenaria mercenaria TaxID=6596 RepID=UPI00234EA4CA|nr:N-lysine methyltransferase KMT5A-A-like [Mercenaria mercenaria]
MIRNGKFLAEYHGVLSKADDVKDKDTNYTYFFDFNGVKYCIDASEEPKLYQPSLGRLVNHADKKQQRNSRITVIGVNGVPHLVLFATRFDL